MNGSSEVLFRNSYTSPKKHKANKSLEDEEFDYVFHDIPNESFNLTKSELYESAIEYEEFKKTGKLFPSKELESPVENLNEEQQNYCYQGVAKEIEVVSENSTHLKSSSENQTLSNVLKSISNKRKKEPENILESNRSETTSRKKQKLEEGIDENKPPQTLVDGNISTAKIESSFAIDEEELSKIMMGDYPDDQSRSYLMNGDSMVDYNVATLINMGNTCYLNSVLYALRFTPTFPHNLHHLLMDIYYVNNKLKENRTKTSSLGRNGSAVSGNSYRSSSSKDLLSIGNNDILPKLKDQIVTENLHALFRTMSNLEIRDSPEPYQPEALLQAIRDAKQLFEGNHQQDAHELFMELLGCLRVTCDKLIQQLEENPELLKPIETASSNLNNSKIWAVGRSWKKPLKKKDKNNGKKNMKQENEKIKEQKESEEPNDLQQNNGEIPRKKIGYNFIAEEFEGVSIHRTMCLNCEEISELKEPFLEIQVPVNFVKEDVEMARADYDFSKICATSELLCDQNKYFCENCNTYCEALREVVYEKLPNILVLHLKRFMTTSTSVQKVNTFAPTPLEIRCFCESCTDIDLSRNTPHSYKLCCVVMHLGASMASGHYMTYARLPEQTYDYMDCTRNTPKEFQTKDLSGNILKFIKSKTLGNSLNGTPNGLGMKKNDIQVCPGMQCCGVKCKLNYNSSSRCCDDWLEFDDEKARILSSNQFVDMLNRSGDTTNTPYVLFYSKV